MPRRTTEAAGAEGVVVAAVAARTAAARAGLRPGDRILANPHTLPSTGLTRSTADNTRATTRG
jgi:C-terminal processing protease CtpA/Prc